MKKLVFMPLLLIAVILITITGCKDGANKNAIVEFKGGSLTTQDLDAHYEKLKKNRTFKGKIQELTPDVVFNHALNMEMIIAKGLDEKLHLDPRIRAEIHEFMSDLFLRVMQDSLVSKINKEEFTEEELKQFYTEHKDNYKDKALYSVKMIKMQRLQPAKEVIEKLQTGRFDFNGAAAKYSMDKKSKNRGGDIGKRALLKFKKTWQPVISSLETGKVSGPHKIGTDYYIFKLTNKTKPLQHSFKEKKAYIKNDLMYVKYKEAWQNTYDRLKKEFKVEIDEKRLAAFIDRSK